MGRGGGWGLYLVCVNVGLTSEMIWCDVGEKNSSAFPELNLRTFTVTTALTKSQRLSITFSQFPPFHRLSVVKFITGCFQTKRLSRLHHNSQHDASSHVRSWALFSSRAYLGPQLAFNTPNLLRQGSLSPPPSRSPRFPSFPKMSEN